MFKGRHFDRSVILLCVRWYLAYSLSLRNLEEMMAERGIAVDHATIHRWVIRYSPELLERFNSRKRAATGRYRQFNELKAKRIPGRQIRSSRRRLSLRPKPRRLGCGTGDDQRR
jgi:transposase-like protein